MQANSGPLHTPSTPEDGVKRSKHFFFLENVAYKINFKERSVEHQARKGVYTTLTSGYGLKDYAEKYIIIELSMSN